LFFFLCYEYMFLFSLNLNSVIVGVLEWVEANFKPVFYVGDVGLDESIIIFSVIVNLLDLGILRFNDYLEAFYDLFYTCSI
jgi:hypothetical protein